MLANLSPILGSGLTSHWCRRWSRPPTAWWCGSFCCLWLCPVLLSGPRWLISSGAPSRAGKSSHKSVNSFCQIFSASLKGTGGVFTPTAIAAVPDAWLTDRPWLVPITSANGVLGESECLLEPLPSFAALGVAILCPRICCSWKNLAKLLGTPLGCTSTSRCTRRPV